MTLLATSLIALIALLHTYFLVLEMFLFTKPLGLKVFRNNFEQAQNSAVLAANQGLYNGILAAGLIWSLFISNPEWAVQVKIFFLLSVFVAGCYGGYSVHRKIFYIQAAPAFLTLLLIFFGYA